jgi:general stress protein 26
MDSEMQEGQEFRKQAAISKFRKLIDHSPICLFATMLDQQPIKTRPMAVRKICNQGNFWFLSSIDSRKNIEVALDERVQLFFSNAPLLEFMSIYGKGTIITDKHKVKELWNETVKTWFIEGVDEPTLSIIKVEPLHAEYWDVKRGKMASMLENDSTEVSDLLDENNGVGKLIPS